MKEQKEGGCIYKLCALIVKYHFETFPIDIAFSLRLIMDAKGVNQREGRRLLLTTINNINEEYRVC